MGVLQEAHLKVTHDSNIRPPQPRPQIQAQKVGMNNKLDFDVQYDLICREIDGLHKKGLLLPDLVDGYMIEEDFGRAFPIKFSDALHALAETKQKYFRLKTRALNVYDANDEMKDLSKLFSKYRTKSIIGCFPYTSPRHPWPVNEWGDIIPPMLQLDLSMLSQLGIDGFGDGLLQVFASSVGEQIRIIPKADLGSEEMDKNYLLGEEMCRGLLERFVKTHRVIQEIYPAGTIVNQRMASSLENCLVEFTNNLESEVAAKYKKLVSLLDNVVHDDSRRGSYMFGWGWNYVDHDSFDDCFMQLEGPEFDFIDEVMYGCGCLRCANGTDFTLVQHSFY
jgi:hypothetical protein